MERAPEEPRASDWYTCIRHARPFSEVRKLPPSLLLPVWFPATAIAVTLAGAAFGFATEAGPVPARIASGVFLGCLALYVAVSSLDGLEHARLEKHVTGRYLGWTVVPLGESALHLAVVGTLAANIHLARMLDAPPEGRDWFVLAAPLLFLALGWCDELIYHRRRALHREDILHTVSHLAAGTMLVALFVSRMLCWPGVE